MPIRLGKLLNQIYSQDAKNNFACLEKNKSQIEYQGVITVFYHGFSIIFLQPHADLSGLTETCELSNVNLYQDAKNNFACLEKNESQIEYGGARN